MTVAVFLFAFVFGIVAAIAPVGPVTVLVIRRSLLQDWRGALRIGLGRVPPETIYCGLATFGTAALLDQFPRARLVIESAGTALIFGLGIWFATKDHAPPEDEHEAENDDRMPDRRGDWAGFFISALNPTLLLSWSAIAAISMSMSRITPTTAHKVVFPLGVGSGIACGYLGLIWTMRRYAADVNADMVSRAIRGIGVVFIATAVWNALKLFQVF